MPYVVPASRLPLLTDPPFVIVLFWLCLAIGYRFQRLIRLDIGTATLWERGTVATALGLGFLQYATFLLGIVPHALQPGSVIVVFVLLLVIFLRDMLRVAAVLLRQFRAPQQIIGRFTQENPLVVVFLIALAVPLFVMLMRSLSPPIDIDDMGYHLNAPKRWLQAGGLIYLPTFINTQAPLGVEMLYLFPMAFWSDTAAKLIHFAMGVMDITAIFVLAARYKQPLIGALLCFVLFFGFGPNTGITQFAKANVELGLVFQHLAALLAWLIWTRNADSTEASIRRKNGTWLLCAALCAGFATTYKLTGCFIVLALATGTLLWLRRQKQPWRSDLRTVALFVTIALLPVIPWLLRTYVLTGNPVYPTLAGIFPSRDWSPAAGKAISNYFRYFNWGWHGRAVGWGWAQRRFAVNIASALGLIVGVGIALRSRDREVSALTLMGTILGVCSLQTMGLAPRMLMPMLIPILLAFCLIFTRWVRNRRAIWFFVIAFCSLFCLYNARNNDLSTSIPAATGRISRLTYLQATHPDLLIWDFINRKVPNDGAIAVSGFYPAAFIPHGFSYYCDRFVYNTDFYQQDRFRMDTYAHYLDDLRSNDVRYLIVPTRKDANMSLSPGYAPAENELGFAWRVTREKGTLLYENSEKKLYRLKLPKDN